MQVNTSLLKEFKNYFGKELRHRPNRDFSNVFYINKSRVRDIAFFLDEKSINLKNILINDFKNNYEVIYEYFSEYIPDNRYLFVITEVDKASNEIDSIRVIYPYVECYEDEITKRYGINFLYFKEELEESLFSYPAELFSVHFPKNILRQGVFNRIHLVNNYFHFNLENKIIKSVDFKTGWLYRGITPLLKYKNWAYENLQLLEKICSTSSFHHSLAYSLAIESILNISVSNRVKMIRTIYCELERMINHIQWFANLMYLTYYFKEYNNLLNKSLELHKLIEEVLGIGYFEKLNYIGYVKDLPLHFLDDLPITIEGIYSSIFEILNNRIYSSHLKKRFTGLGALSVESALESGVTGPNIRASGQNYDVRYYYSYNSYLDKDIIENWEVVSFNDGDAYSRIQVRFSELKNSVSIIKRAVDYLQSDETKIDIYDLSNIKLDANEIGISIVEAPQGELVYFIKTDDRPGKESLGSVSIQTPTMNNLFALKNFILPNSNIKDFPLLVHSMDLCFNCLDL